MHTLARVGGAVLAVGLPFYTPAHAEWFGGVGIASDNIERGVSQSDRQASANAQLGLRHAAGAYASLGIASVSDTQFVGSHGYKLAPELGWSFADLGPDKDWRAGVFLRGQVFPGARGPWFGSLPPRLQAQAAQFNRSDYGTLEVGGALGWKIVTLSVSRSLTDYLGLSATQTGPAGERVIDSKGTTYIGLDVDWPLNDRFTMAAGAGRLHVPNFDGLSYSDWRLGASLQAAGLRWGVQASGSDADGTRYRLRNRSSSNSSAGETRLTASVGWSF
jgi:Bacterial protein of unknown function (Gcw_chp)